jgi:DNA polymerase-3 subunit delta
MGSLDRYRKLFDDLKKKGPRRLYLLYGPEEYIKKEFVSELVKATLGDQKRAFNLDIFHSDEFDRDAFHDRISTFPLFSDRRVVVVRRFDDLSVSNQDFVLDRIEATPDSLTVAVETSADKMDTARLKRLKQLADAQGLSFRFQPLSDEETIERARARLRREGLEVEPDALDLLVESIGTQLIDVTNELEKIILAAPPGGVVNRRLVGDVVGHYRTENLFAFLDRLGSDDLASLISRMNRLIDGGEEPVLVMAMLMKRVVLLLEVSCLMAEKGPRISPQAIAGMLAGQTSPYYVTGLIQQAKRMDIAALHRLLENLRWADLKLKTTSIPARSVLETALIASSARKTLDIHAA